jgi:hypothetical protein
MPDKQARPYHAHGRATGPRTAAGKRRASKNAQRHGLTAAHPDPAASAARLAQLRDDPLLAGLEVALLTRLVEADLRVARATAHQHQLLTRDATDPAPDAHAFHCALRYRAEAEVAARKALRAVLDALQAQRPEKAGAA